MKVRSCRPQTHLLVFVVEKGEQRVAQVGLCCLGNDLRCGSTNRPVLVVEGSKQQVTRFLGFRSAQEQEHFGAVRQTGFLQELLDRGKAVPGAGDGFSAIKELLKEPGLSDRAEVLLLLSRTKTQESRDLLLRALHDEDWSVRAAATQVIAQTAQADLRDSLLPLFDDKNQKVRLRAAGAYLHLSLVEQQ